MCFAVHHLPYNTMMLSREVNEYEEGFVESPHGVH